MSHCFVLFLFVYFAFNSLLYWTTDDTAKLLRPRGAFGTFIFVPLLCFVLFDLLVSSSFLMENEQMICNVCILLFKLSLLLLSLSLLLSLLLLLLSILLLLLLLLLVF